MTDEMKNVKAYRRLLHLYPETGWLTYFATCFLAEHLQEAGYEVFVGREIFGDEKLMDEPDEAVCASHEERAAKLAETVGLARPRYWLSRMARRAGVVAVLDTGRKGPVRAYRFDIDALTVEESRDPGRVPVEDGFCSAYPGVFHACGHDGHTAIGLTLAERIARERARLDGKFIFIFQPAEEGARGAVPMCRRWRWGKIDRLFCCHIGFAPEDTLVAGARGFFATSKFDVDFYGKSAHAGLAPERGRNALLAAAEAVVEMQRFQRPDGGVTRLNVGVFTGGEARNTIPAHAGIRMETRGETTELNEYMKREALRCVEVAAQKYGVRYEVEQKGECTSAVSDEELAALVLEAAQKSGGFLRYAATWEFGASDDATIFMDMVKSLGGQAVYLLFGTKVNGLHHERDFDFSEDVLEKAVEVLYETAKIP